MNKPTPREVNNFIELWSERERIMDEENNLAKMRANKRFKELLQTLPSIRKKK